MRLLARLNCDQRAAAAVEMALAAPLLLIIMCGSIEVGNYFFNEHKLVKAVRDGARYAARQSFANYSSCDTTARNLPTPGTVGSIFENTKLMVRKGSLSGADADLLPKWSAANTSFSVQMLCPGTGSYNSSGLYAGSGTGAPVVTVTARLPYQPILSSFGFRGSGYYLNASQQAAVMGL